MCYLSKGDIQQRGWSQGMINTFLPPSTLIVTSPTDRRRKTTVWTINEVETAEKRPEFVKRKKQYCKYLTTIELHKKSKCEMLEKTQQYINHIQIPDYTYEGVIDMVTRTHKGARIKSLKQFAVNQLRHDVDGYDDWARMYANKEKSFVYYAMVKVAILRKIAKRYPFLAAECTRQERVFMRRKMIVSQEIVNQMIALSF